MAHPGLKGKVALITGSSSGIGAATAVILAKNGCKVVLNGRNTTKLDKVHKDCLAAGLGEKDILVMAGDVTNDSFVEDCVKKTLDQFGQLDILINNAGMIEMGGVDVLGLDSLERTMACNVRAPTLFSKLCIPHLIKQKGSVVNVSSIAGLKAFPLSCYYCMSKAALDQLTKVLALQFGPQGVRVNSVNPGMVKTDIIVGLLPPGTNMDQMYEASARDYPLQRIGEPEDIAKMIVFLADNDCSAYTTGQLIAMEGGLLLPVPMAEGMKALQGGN